MIATWAMTPRQSIERECVASGQAAFISRCLAILVGEDIDPAFLFVLAGPATSTVMAGGEGGLDGYWPRVWALRGLLHSWQAGNVDAAHAVIAATKDESWRVREMAAKVVAAHRVDAAAQAMADLVDDPVARVRSAAHRAVLAVTTSR